MNKNIREPVMFVRFGDGEDFHRVVSMVFPNKYRVILKCTCGREERYTARANLTYERINEELCPDCCFEEEDDE